MTYKSDDVDLLVPAFADEVRTVLWLLRERGLDPVPFDTLRTPEEAALNAARGVGIAKSMHCYGVACDVICGRHGWGCYKNRCDFFAHLGAVVKARQLVWGGDWRRKDLPHFQCVPVWMQPRIRRASREQIEKIVSVRLKRRRL